MFVSCVALAVRNGAAKLTRSSFSPITPQTTTHQITRGLASSTCITPHTSRPVKTPKTTPHTITRRAMLAGDSSPPAYHGPYATKETKFANTKNSISQHELYGIQQKMLQYNIKNSGAKSLSPVAYMASIVAVLGTVGAVGYYGYEYRFNMIKPIISAIRPYYVKFSGYQHLYAYTSPHPLSKLQSLEFDIEALEKVEEFDPYLQSAQRIVLKEVFKLYHYYDELNDIRLLLPELAPVPGFRNNHQHQLRINEMYAEYLEAEQILFKALTTGFMATVGSESKCLYTLNEVLTSYKSQLIKGLRKGYEEDLEAYEAHMVEDVDKYRNDLHTRTKQGTGIVRTPKNPENIVPIEQASPASLVFDHPQSSNETHTQEYNLNKRVKSDEVRWDIQDRREIDEKLSKRTDLKEKGFRLRELFRGDRSFRREITQRPTSPDELIEQLENDDKLVLKHYISHLMSILAVLQQHGLMCESLINELRAQEDALKKKHIEYDRQRTALKIIESQKAALERAMNAQKKTLAQSMDAQMSSNRSSNQTLMVNGLTMEKLDEQSRKLAETIITEYDFIIDSKPLVDLYAPDTVRSFTKLVTMNQKEYWAKYTKFPDRLYDDSDMVENPDTGEKIEIDTLQELYNGLITARNYLVKENLTNINQIPFSERKPPIETLSPEQQEAYTVRYWGCVDVELIHQLNRYGLSDLEKIKPTVFKLDKMIVDHTYNEKNKNRHTKSLVRMVSAPVAFTQVDV